MEGPDVMRRRLLPLVACCLAGVLIVGCGGDDGEADTADAATSGADSEVVDDTVPADDASDEPAGDSATGDDLLNQYLATFGLNSDIMTTDQAGCMNDELDTLYPEGFPGGWESTSNVTDDVDVIAEACGVEL